MSFLVLFEEVTVQEGTLVTEEETTFGKAMLVGH